MENAVKRLKQDVRSTAINHITTKSHLQTHRLLLSPFQKAED